MISNLHDMLEFFGYFKKSPTNSPSSKYEYYDYPDTETIKKNIKNTNWMSYISSKPTWPLSSDIHHNEYKKANEEFLKWNTEMTDEERKKHEYKIEGTILKGFPIPKYYIDNIIIKNP